MFFFDLYCSKQNIENLTYIIVFLIVLSSKKCSSSNNDLSESESTKSFQHCQKLNWKELIFIYNGRQQENLSEQIEKQVDKNGCACSRRSSKSQENRLFEHKNKLEVTNFLKEDASFLDFKQQQDKRIGYDNNEYMILLENGKFIKGTNTDNAILTDYEKPSSVEYVNKFYLDRFEVSNLDFSLFVLLTHYKTDAELFKSSFVFEGLLSDKQQNEIKKNELNYQVAQAPWWLELNNVNWFKLDGDQSNFKLSIRSLIDKFNHTGLANKNRINLSKIDYFNWIKQYTFNVELLIHPVVHVSWRDAFNYCKWLDKRLPTEKEWEYACKSDIKEDLKYPWGDELNPNGDHLANLWQGIFPSENTVEDGFYGTCPVDSLKNQTKSGFKHLIGNVWEWTSDDWSMKRRKSISKPMKSSEQKKVKKGGSFLCHKSYCNRYRCSSRDFATSTTTASNLGFRCAKDA